MKTAIHKLIRTTLVFVCAFLSYTNIYAQTSDWVPGGFTVKVDGKKWAYNAEAGVAIFNKNSGELTIIGETEDKSERLIINLAKVGDRYKNGFEKGEYIFNGKDPAIEGYKIVAAYKVKQDGATQMWYGLGRNGFPAKLIISEITSGNIKGKFFFDVARLKVDGNFDLSEFKKITEGAFDLEIIEQ